MNTRIVCTEPSENVIIIIPTITPFIKIGDHVRELLPNDKGTFKDLIPAEVNLKDDEILDNYLKIFNVESLDEKLIDYKMSDDDFIEYVRQKDVPIYRDYLLKDSEGNVIESDQNGKARMGISDLGSQIPHRITAVESIPSDRSFRAAWTDEAPGEQLDVDMPKAQVIHMDAIRTDRNKKLQALDLDYTKASEAGNTTLMADVATQKQVLRDLPTTFDLSGATNANELKSLWPGELNS
jgi:hypothetical protein